MLSGTKLSVPTDNSTTIVSPRTGSSVVSFPNNLILVFGGASLEEGVSNQLFICHIEVASKTTRWTPLYHSHSGPLPPPRYDHAACWIPSLSPSPSPDHDHSSIGLMLIMGGAGSNDSCLNDIWIYNPVNFSWQQLNPSGHLPSPRIMRGACVNHPRYPHRVFLWGGGVNVSSPVLDNYVHELDLVSCRWIQHQSPSSIIPSPRLGHFFIPHGRHDLVMIGGMNGGTILSELWTFSLASWEWTLIADKPEFAVSGHVALNLPRTPQCIASQQVTSQVLPDLDLGAIIWAGGLTSNMEVSNKWYITSKNCNWSPNSIQLPKPLFSSPNMARLDHSLFLIDDSLHPTNGDTDTAPETETDHFNIVMFGGMNHLSVFHDVHLFNLYL